MPVYWPTLAGIQLMEYSGVSEAVKNVMAMESIPIIESVDVDIDIEELVELAIAMAAVVLVAAIDIVTVELVIDINISMVRLACCAEGVNSCKVPRHKPGELSCFCATALGSRRTSVVSARRSELGGGILGSGSCHYKLAQTRAHLSFH